MADAELEIYFNPDGKPISQDQWLALFEERGSGGDEDWWKVGDDELGGYEVHTMWMGVDIGYATAPWKTRAMIYETMVFGDGPLAGETMRYATREEAESGHAAMVERVREMEAVESE